MATAKRVTHKSDFTTIGDQKTINVRCGANAAGTAFRIESPKHGDGDTDRASQVMTFDRDRAKELYEALGQFLGI